MDAESPEIQLQVIKDTEDKDADSLEKSIVSRDTTGADADAGVARRRSYKWWLRMAIYAIFVLAGQSTATILGRLYYENGGKSMWMVTLVQTAGFPVLIPLYFLSSYQTSTEKICKNPPSILSLSAIYVVLGVIVAGFSMLYAVGLLNLPVSIFSLITPSSQLAFTAVFSFFLNSQKFTAFIINSLLLLTISSALLAFQNDPGESNPASKRKFAVGFVCTVAASAGYGLQLCLTQLCFEKVLRKRTFKVVLDMIIYQSVVATTVIVVGLFASGDWKRLNSEMEGFELGKGSYVNILVGIAITLQVFSIGSVGLIFEVSSLFSNVIGILGLPIVPILAIVIFNDEMSGIKAISLVLAIWGFVSYVYQHYLHDCNSNIKSKD